MKDRGTGTGSGYNITMGNIKGAGPSMAARILFLARWELKAT